MQGALLTRRCILATLNISLVPTGAKSLLSGICSHLLHDSNFALVDCRCLWRDRERTIVYCCNLALLEASQRLSFTATTGALVARHSVFLWLFNLLSLGHGTFLWLISAVIAGRWAHNICSEARQGVVCFGRQAIAQYFLPKLVLKATLRHHKRATVDLLFDDVVLLFLVSLRMCA